MQRNDLLAMIKDLEQQLQDYSQLSTNYSNLINKFNYLQSDFNFKVEENQNLQAKLKDAENILNSTTSTIDSQNDKIARLTADNQRLRKSSDSVLSHAVVQMNEKISQLPDNSNDLLQQKFELLQNQFNQMQHKYDNSIHTIEQYQKQIISTESEIQSLKSKNFTNELKINEQNKLIEDLTNQLTNNTVINIQESSSSSNESYHVDYHPSDELMRKIADLESKISKLTTENEKLKISEAEKTISLQNSKQKLEEHLSFMKEVENRNQNEIQKQSQTAQLEQQKIQFQFEKLNSELSLLQSENKRLSEVVNGQNLEIQNFHFTQNQKYFKFIQTQQSEVESFLAEKDTLIKTQADLRNEIAKLEMQRDENLKQIEKYHQKCKKQSRQVKQAQIAANGLMLMEGFNGQKSVQSLSFDHSEKLNKYQEVLENSKK